MPRGRPTGSTLRGFLCLICLDIFAAMRTHGRPGCGFETTQLVGELIQRVQEMEAFDSRLYTPTLDDYENCPRSTLSCFAKEAYVLNLEWPTNAPLLQPANRTTPRRVAGRTAAHGLRAPDQGASLARRLGGLGQQLQQTDRGRCEQCEAHAEEEVKVFLGRLYEVLQRINSEICSSSANSRS
ncbi:interleukin 15, like isoform X1 [Lampris incognitus]|uniref:interleukin 15, like isoform X1 n=1 Tax=Lampris incognitus TaxID=2546036 RepID=UPI0024B58C7E|nr:interleukin 15, like isoform X1 [Lampris incognitus]